MTPRLASIRVSLVVCLAIVLAASALAADKPAPPAGKEPGELWESTVQMSGMGMNMPPQTTRACRPLNAEWNEPPGADKKSECEIEDLRTSAGMMTWTMKCKNPPATAKGEITFQGKDAYQGTMAMTTDQGEMSMKLSGRNLHQACDAGEIKREVAAIQAQSAASMAAMCADGAKHLALMMFDGPAAVCKEPEQKQAFCKELGTLEGYRQLSPDPKSPTSASAAAAFCGTSTDAVLSKLCKEALASEDLDFLGQFCPDETKTLAERECAGRKYTALAGSKYQSFCLHYAADLLVGNKPAESKPAESDPKQSSIDKAKKKLKGLFGK